MLQSPRIPVFRGTRLGNGKLRDHPGLYSVFQANLGYLPRPCLNDSISNINSNDNKKRKEERDMDLDTICAIICAVFAVLSYIDSDK